jgi:hypothetical protein
MKETWMTPDCSLQSIAIDGPAGAGKSTVAEHLERLTGLKRVETDRLIEDHFFEQYGQRKTCRELYTEFGQETFRAIEKHVAGHLEEADWQLIVCGGSSLVDPASRRASRSSAQQRPGTASRRGSAARTPDSSLKRISPIAKNCSAHLPT